MGRWAGGTIIIIIIVIIICPLACGAATSHQGAVSGSMGWLECRAVGPCVHLAGGSHSDKGRGRDPMQCLEAQEEQEEFGMSPDCHEAPISFHLGKRNEVKFCFCSHHGTCIFNVASDVACVVLWRCFCPFSFWLVFAVDSGMGGCVCVLVAPHSPTCQW